MVMTPAEWQKEAVALAEDYGNVRSSNALMVSLGDVEYKRKCDAARAALLAHIRTVPSGYALVPAVPTREMLMPR